MPVPVPVPVSVCVCVYVRVCICVCMQRVVGTDERANVEALIQTGGSVENAISRLTS